MPISNAESNLIKVSTYEIFCNRTALGMVSTSDFEFDDGTKTSDVKGGPTGDAALKLYQKTGNAKFKFKLITTNHERIKLFYNALTYQGGAISGNTQGAKELRQNIWTAVPRQVLADGTQYDEVNLSPDAVQLPRGVAVNGFGFKAGTDKAHEYDVEVMGIPDLDSPGLPSWRRGSTANSVVLPAPAAMFVDTIVKGVGYTTKPTITVTSITGFTADSQILADGSLNIIITNPGTTPLAALNTWIPLVLTGGTSTTAQTARVYIG